MVAFDFAWSVLKADYSQPLSQEQLDEMLGYISDYQNRATRARDSGQIYPEGNLSAYHPAIAGLMQRKNIQDTFNEGMTREQFEHEKQFEDYPGELEFFERDDFQDELSGADPFSADARARMNFDEMMGNITRESMGHARAPSDERIDARAVQRLMEEGRPSMKFKGYARDMFHPRFGDFYSGR